MKVLVICSGNAPKGQKFDLKIHQAFIYEQVQALETLGVECHYFLIRGRGIFGYLKHMLILKNKLSQRYELLHAHNGLCGMIANFQRKIPVVTTYHGSDINLTFLRIISYFAILRSTRNILVSERLLKKTFIKRNASVIPCGVDMTVFYEQDKTISKKSAKLDIDKNYILFASAFSNKIKNISLVNSAMNQELKGTNELLEIKNRTRSEVALLINSSELLILTSYSEGSPQIIKEAMACNCPIVSTDVGDVWEIICNTEGCYITSFDPADVAEKIKLALEFSSTKGRTCGRHRILELGLDSVSVAKIIIEEYERVLYS